MTSNTALPTAADTGFPPKVLKYSMPVSKAEAISRVVATAPSGCPFPMGFPIVTTSGTTPCNTKDQNDAPTRPKPACTSSTMINPPRARTVS